jgi:gentisate 1,2-dioxygenase
MLEERSMTDVIQAPGIGHNQPDPLEMEKKNQKWDRWAKKRTFVRALEGTYSHLYKTLKEEKRVYSAQDVAWKGGPQMFGKSVISPQATSIIQSIESHIEAYAPKTGGQKHGHLNSAVFYVLKGHGYDIHDGRKIPWKAGDVMLVENGCVHQHFNDSDKEECIHLVFKAKPLFLFMHLLLQKMVEWPPELDPALGPYSPPKDL